MDLSNNIFNTLIRLCNIKSTSGTAEEASGAEAIYSIISELGYFKEHRDNLKLHDIEGDIHGRKFVSAFLNMGFSRKTVVLLSHFDVVGIEEFGHLKDLAYKPVEYTKRLKFEYLPARAKEDLNTGDWLFGRGTMDMKCGLAIHIELLRYIYENKAHMGGNILLITVPDEENSSIGMLSAVNYLSSLKDEGYEFQAVINSEPFFEEYPGDRNKYIYTGTIGKLLPTIFFAGIETHAGEPFNGISSSLLSSITTSIIEANTELCENYGDYTAPPPICLKQMDLKKLYNVSTPSFSYAYYNYMTLKSNPADVINKLKHICLTAFDKALNKMTCEVLKYSEITGRKTPSLSIKPNVMTYEELCMVLEEKGIDIDVIKSKYKNCNSDTRDMTANIIADILKLLPELRPVIIVSLAPPYYPHRLAGKEFKNIIDVCSKVIERSKKLHNEELLHREAFPGLCDFSYLGLEDPDSYYTLKANMPVLDLAYNLPLKALCNINIGAVNIGVMGRDVHKYTERLYMPYSFNVTPDLILYAIKEFLA